MNVLLVAKKAMFVLMKSVKRRKSMRVRTLTNAVMRAVASSLKSSICRAWMPTANMAQNCAKKKASLKKETIFAIFGLYFAPFPSVFYL